MSDEDRALTATAREFLQGEPQGDGTWRFAIGRERHGAFGGAFGGLLAACCVHTARAITPGKVAASIDARFVRGLPAGDAQVVPQVVHDGRTLSTLSLDILDERERIATRATVGLVDTELMAGVEHDGETPATPVVHWRDATPWAQVAGPDIPIITTFRPRTAGRAKSGIATALRVPWSDDPDAFAEAACLAADMSVGPPVAGAFPGRPTPAPNPDLSLRFTGRPVGDDIVGWARLERIHHGLATTRIEVRSGSELVAVGVSCSLILGGG